MGWTKYDDSYDDDAMEKPTPKRRKSHGRENTREEEEPLHRKKRSGIRAHRKKTHKDEFGEENS
jgi:hypothetical protein